MALIVPQSERHTNSKLQQNRVRAKIARLNTIVGMDHELCFRPSAPQLGRDAHDYDIFV